MSGPAARRRVVLSAVGLLVGGAFVGQHGCGREGPAPKPGAPRPPSAILIIVDTLRSDALCGAHGEPALMPATHALARRGVLFPNGVAPAPWTVPSVTSLLTGLKPHAHGLSTMTPVLLLPDPVRTWAQVLAARGYQTAAYTGAPFGWTGPHSVFKGLTDGRAAAQLGRAPLDLGSWWRSLDHARPFFLVLHYYEVHDPYGARNYRLPGEAPPPPFDPALRADRVTEPWELTRYFMLDRAARDELQRAKGTEDYFAAVVRYLWSGYRAEPRPALAAELRAAYDAGVRWVDGLLAEIYAWFEKEHVLEDAVLALTADHGEAFGEHGTLEHGRVCFDEVLRVPLVLLGRGTLGSGRVITANVSLMDVVPTLFEACGQPLPPGVEGTSLLPLIEGGSAPRVAESQERVVFDVTREDIDWSLRSLRSDRWKAIFTWDRRTGSVREEAYDLVADPAEQDDLARRSGTLAGLAFDPVFCREIDRVRADLASEGATAVLSASCAPK